MKPSPALVPLWQAALALLIAPFALQAIGLTLTSATDLIIYAMAAIGLNLLVGFTGLTSFGHGAWFGIGAYAAALAHLHLFKGSFVAPMLFAIVFIALLATVFGFLILRRRGVYFSLLTLALSALTFAVCFRWTALTGGESGLGGIVRPAIGPVNLDDPVVFLVLVSLIGLTLVFVLNRLLRSPIGHVLVAIRENEQRATFQGYDTNRYKLIAFVVSATVTGMSGALLAFLHRFTSAEVTSVVFSGELLAMVQGPAFPTEVRAYAAALAQALAGPDSGAGTGTATPPAIPDPVPATPVMSTLTIRVTAAGMSLQPLVVGSVPRPASQEAFCSEIASAASGISLSAAIPSTLGSVTLRSCSLAGNVGTVGATLSLQSPFPFTTQGVATYTYE
jgi:ABC-type branched-subunit amino acid transport system permease subunit